MDDMATHRTCEVARKKCPGRGAREKTGRGKDAGTAHELSGIDETPTKARTKLARVGLAIVNRAPGTVNLNLNQDPEPSLRNPDSLGDRRLVVTHRIDQ